LKGYAKMAEQAVKLLSYFWFYNEARSQQPC